MRLPQPRSLVPLVRALSAWLLVLLASVAVLPGFVPGAAADPARSAAPLIAVATFAGDPGGAAEDEARDRRAWLSGREASGRAAADQAAAERVARGSGATAATPAAWIVPAGADPTIPPLTLRAYRTAAAWASGYDPGCRLSWSVLAGIGRIESNHGRHAGAAARFSQGGDVTPPILGPALDGRGGFAAIADSDGGRLDADRVWDRAVGPMQFLPSTWRSLGRDGDGDRVADPGNLFDAAVSAAAYLCLGGAGDLSDPARLRQAVYGYNHSWSYVDSVLGWAAFYARRIGGGPGVLPPLPPTTTSRPPTTNLPATTVPPATTRPPSTTVPPSTTTTPTTPPSTTTPRATTTTGPPSTTTPATTTTQAPATSTTQAPATSTTQAQATSTTQAPATTAPCARPTTTTLPPGSTTTTTTTTTLPPGSTTTTATLPPCPTSTSRP